ncbi:MAG: hypothetical protein ACJ757_01790 [Gaiellaceae bacterium]
MGDGRTLGQAVRALEKFIVEQDRRDTPKVPAANSPFRAADDRPAGGTQQ